MDSTPSSPQHCEFSPEASLGMAHAPGGVLVAVCAESGHRGPLCPSVNLPSSFSKWPPESSQGSAEVTGGDFGLASGPCRAAWRALAGVRGPPECLVSSPWMSFWTCLACFS